jgi:3-oxoacyl-[acyl-carrier-protein] synthase II
MRRVVITGIGSVNPLGETAEKSWQKLISGQSGAGPITGFDVSDLPCQIACHIDRADEAG